MDVLPIKAWRWNQHMNRSIDEALSEIEREAHVRTRCYDRWIEEGKVSRVDAWDRQERLLSAVKHLRYLQDVLKQEAEAATATATVSESALLVMHPETDLATDLTPSNVKFGA